MTFAITLLGLILGFGHPVVGEANICPLSKQDTLKIYDHKTDLISSDPLGQFYLVRENTLVKYSAVGDSVYSWSDPQSGRISLIDTGDPMRLLVYQKDFNLLRFLNNRLAPISGPIRLDDLGITNPLALALARQGGFWVVDGTTFRLKYIDNQYDTKVESEPLNLATANDRIPYRLTESGDQVFLLIPGREIQVFDLFANLIKRIPLKISSMNIYRNLILLVNPDQIALWKDPVTPEDILIRKNGAGFREACLLPDKLLILTREKVLLLTR